MISTEVNNMTKCQDTRGTPLSLSLPGACVRGIAQSRNYFETGSAVIYFLKARQRRVSLFVYNCVTSQSTATVFLLCLNVKKMKSNWANCRYLATIV